MPYDLLRTRRSRWLALAILLSGCAGDAPEEAASIPFSPVADVQQLMASVLEPAAEVYWDAVGWIVDSTGTTYIRPGSVEEWEAVRNSAFVIAETGNLLMMEGRAVDEGAWMGMSQSMIDVATRAIEIAESRDEQGVFDMGAEIYFTCTNCHARYAVETLRPNAQID